MRSRACARQPLLSARFRVTAAGEGAAPPGQLRPLEPSGESGRARMRTPRGGSALPRSTRLRRKEPLVSWGKVNAGLGYRAPLNPAAHDRGSDAHQTTPPSPRCGPVLKLGLCSTWLERGALHPPCATSQPRCRYCAVYCHTAVPNYCAAKLQGGQFVMGEKKIIFFF